MIDVGEIVTVDGERMNVLREGRGPSTAVIEVRQTGIAFLERQPGRARCAYCRIRRVRYRIGVRTALGSPEFTEARCAECWGIRTEEG
jgi:hypothetical protein